MENGLHDETDHITVRVKNWRQFQHYKQRRPPWIKLHRELLDNYEFSCLPPASQALAPRLWLLASESAEGEIPDDLAELAFRLRASEKDVAFALKGLSDKGFIEGYHHASATLAERKQNLTAEVEKRQSTEERQIATTADAASPFPSQKAADVFLARHPEGTPEPAMFKALKPLSVKHGWERVAPELEAYLADTPIQFHSWPKFAAGFGTWASKQGEDSLSPLSRHNMKALGLL